MTITEDHLSFLNSLEAWGVKNVSAAAPYLMQQFPELTLTEAHEVVNYWLSTRNQLLSEAK